MTVGLPPMYIEGYSPQTQETPRVLEQTTSSFLDLSFVARVSAESAQAARSVTSYVRVADSRAIDIAALDVTQYSDTARASSSSLASSFFELNNVQEPRSVRGPALGLSSTRLESVEVRFTPGAGVVDGFEVLLRASLDRLDFLNVRDMLVYRATVPLERSVVPLSPAGADRVSAFDFRDGGLDALTDVERLTRERGQAAGLTAVALDPILNMRSDRESAPAASFSMPQGIVQSRISIELLRGIVPAETAALIDPQVATDLATVARIRTLFPSGSDIVPISLGAVRTSDGNGASFSLIASAPAKALPGRSLGDVLEVTFIDRSVVRGSRYAYFVVFTDANGREGRRSSVLATTVDRILPPTVPVVTPLWSGRSVSLHVMCTPEMESIEVFRDDGAGSVYVSTTPARATGVHVTDLRVIPGSSYIYRVYAVDHFGNKSQTPAVVRVDVPVSSSPVSLPPLSVFADVDQRSRYSFVDVHVHDARIRGFFVARRDLSLSERVYRSVLAPASIDVGTVSDESRGFQIDPLFNGLERVSNGYVPIDGPGLHRFVDFDSHVDHTYQYRIHGVDVRGIATEQAATKPVFIGRRPLIDAPSMLTASLEGSGVRISWRETNIPISVPDMLGDREELQFTSVRNVYQLQRKVDAPGHSWVEFPFIDTTGTLDEFSRVVLSRPPAPERGTTYLYRVASFQTGSNYSNYTDPVRVTVPRSTQGVGPISVRPSDTTAPPIFVVVGWNSDNPRGSWLVERAAVNSFAAPSYNNVARISTLRFSRVAEVFPESSRANSVSADADRSRGPLFTTKRYFIDRDVVEGNTYFYRVTALDSTGAPGADSSYGGATVTSPYFESGVKAAISPMRTTLALDTRPIEIK